LKTIDLSDRSLLTAVLAKTHGANLYCSNRR